MKRHSAIAIILLIIILTAAAVFGQTAWIPVVTGGGGGGVTSIGYVAPAAGLTITGTNPVTGTGTWTFALANDLAALEALTGTNTIYYRSGVDTWSAVTIGSGLSFTSGTLAATGGTVTHSVTLYIDGSGSPLTTGVRNPVKLGAFAGTLTGWTMMCKPSGSITVDIQRAADGGGLPVTSMVGAGTKPAIAAGVENSATTFPSWTSTAVSSKDNFAINPTAVDGVVTYCEITLYYQ